MNQDLDICKEWHLLVDGRELEKFVRSTVFKTLRMPLRMKSLGEDSLIWEITDTVGVCRE